MSLVPYTRKRKMDVIQGETSLTSGDPKPSCAKAPCLGKLPQNDLDAEAASGDVAGSEQTHQYMMVVRSLEPQSNQAEVVTHCCELGDVWTHKYPLPLSQYPFHTIRTGNTYYDQILPELPKIGYKVLQVIAKGRSGTILLAQDLRQQTSSLNQEYQPIALKLNTGGGRKQRLVPKVDITKEMLLHCSLQHQNIVSMLDSICLQGRLGLVLEFCEGGNLEQLLRTRDAKFVTEPIARSYFRQIQSAIEYVHQSGIAHRDVCPQNILITSNNVLKLADFGHAVHFTTGDSLVEEPCGTLGYQAPEVIIRCPYNPRLADIWSLGALLYFMAVGKLPYGTMRTEETARILKPVSYPRDNVLFLTSSLKELICGLMAYIPDTRFTHNRIRNSEWMRCSQSKVQIGNFYLVRQPQKTKEGILERRMKCFFEV